MAVSKYCGDRELSGGEQCDDGNLISGDGCSATCQVEVLRHCGDGVPDAGEECDDGNRRDADGCSRFCRHEDGSCGNGRLETALGEQCDDGSRVNGDGCAADCTLEPAPGCGDGVLSPATEQCDDGPGNARSPSACRPNCLAPYCGDGVLDFNEECDDGNNVEGDACSATCEVVRMAPVQAAILPIDRTGVAEFAPGRTIPPPERTKTGPGLVIFLASGAAAGVGLARRRANSTR